MQRSSNHNYSLHMQCVFTQSWLNSFCLAFYIAAKQSNERISRTMFLPLQNLYKCKQVACSVVVACLLHNRLFYTNLLLLVYFFILFLFILILLLCFCLLVDHVHINPLFLFSELLFIFLITLFPYS